MVFAFKMGPYVTDPDSVACKPAYGGSVYLYYSLDGGSSWDTLAILKTYLYRNQEFTEVPQRPLLTWRMALYAHDQGPENIAVTDGSPT